MVVWNNYEVEELKEEIKTLKRGLEEMQLSVKQE